MVRGITVRVKLALSIALAVSCSGLPRTASATPLLILAFASQIETWMGVGSLAFTNLYTKTGGDTSATFHGAVDSKGPTVTLLQATVFAAAESSALFGQTFIIGGYNPFSWDASIGGVLVVNDDALRNAFIYNLTTSQMQSERLGPTIGQPADVQQSRNRTNLRRRV